MDQSTAIEAVAFFGQRLVEDGVRVSKLILFGSHGRNEATNDSDVDVLIISEDFRGKTIFDRADLVCGAERDTIYRFHIPTDVLMMTPEEFDSGASLMAQGARTGTIILPRISEPVFETSRASPK